MNYTNKNSSRGRNRNWFPRRKNTTAPKGSQASTASTSTLSSRPITVNLSECIGPYKSWKLYFPSEEYLETSETVKKIKAAQKYLEKNMSSLEEESADRSGSVNLDLLELYGDQDFLRDWGTIRDDLVNKPEHTLGCIAIAMQQVLKTEMKISLKILNHQPVLSPTNLKVNFYGKLVTVKGTVIRVGSVGLKCLSMAFKCSSCHNKQAVIQPQGIFTLPTYCNICRNMSKFEPFKSSNYTTTIDWQTLRIQEMQTQSVSGTIPRSVEVELQGDLVGSVCPGDVALITGIVRVHGEAKGGEDGKKAARLLQLYVEAVSIQSQRNLSHPTLTFTDGDYGAINDIHGCGDVLRLLVHSLCPSIYGHEMVKAGLILGLMGGKESEKGCRPNPHVLIVGDPGLGKSQLLQAAALAAPRGIYVCGASASASGLTVALGRDSGGDFALEAGALVLADRGVCCVDELDKMTANHGSLLEAMEQRTVSIAKGGVVCCLSARATVLAAANPVGGHYNRAKTVSENLKMSSPLLSRFDLVFILLDQPNERLDALLSEHVLAMHSSKKRKTSQNYPRDINDSVGLDDSLNNHRKLSETLQLRPEEVVDSLPLVLLRKYIAYAQKYVHPKLSTEASNELRDFYLQLRRLHENENTPITTRQLEACIRLTQARARVDLREKATAQDAKNVIEIMKHSLVDTFSDEFGTIQLSRSIFGSGMSSRSAIKKFIDILTRQSANSGKDTFSKKELCQIHKMNGLGGNANDLIESLHTHGYLLLKGPGLYKVLSA